MSDVVIFGTGVFAEVVHYYLTKYANRKVVAFTVDGSHIKQESLLDLPVVPFEGLTTSHPPKKHEMFVAAGYKNINRFRAEVCEKARGNGYKLLTFVSPKCTFETDAIGDNCFIFEDNTVQPYTKIGNNVIMWSGNHIGHHSTIGDNCFITSHVVVSGNVTVGRNTFIGVNATIRDSIQIGEYNVIGSGALIMKSTQDKEVYIAERTKPSGKTSDAINL
jgi:sugar O-acyltransferase (sialic acid O-acetyltransferase NeuD family)